MNVQREKQTKSSTRSFSIEQRKTFRFFVEHCCTGDEQPYCDVHIHVVLNPSTQIFHVNYTYSYSCEKGKAAHPFVHLENMKINHMDGDIIKYNEMSQMLIRYLLMDDSELEKLCGHSTPQHYRTMIMKSIANFWD